MINRPFDDVAFADLENLRINQVGESKTLEYKQSLPGSTDSERKEFLADVSAFANAVGGDLLYGIAESRDNGKPTGLIESIPGLPGINADAELMRLENMLRDGLAPRIPGARFRWVSGGSDGPVLLVRIPRSWAGPHMVTFQQTARFYSRSSAGKYPLDVFELREAFLRSGSARDRAKEFRTERLGRLLADETPVPLTGNHLFCIHFIPDPLSPTSVDLDMLKQAHKDGLLQPLYSNSWGHSYNIDGFLTFNSGSDGKSSSYLQVHRTGSLEAVTTRLLDERDKRGLTLPSLTAANEVASFLLRATRLMKALELSPPAFVFLSLLRARGGILGLSERLTFYEDQHPTPFDRDTLLLRGLEISDWRLDEPYAVVKPLLDELWQAAGLERCFDYDRTGKWSPK